MNVETDFLIVGQGLAGSLLAYEMEKKNIDYRIISSENKSAASFVAAAMYNPLVFKRLTKSWQIDELLPVMLNTYKELEVLLKQTFLYDKNIMKPLTENDIKLWRKKAANVKFDNYIKQIDEDIDVPGFKKHFAWAQVSGSGSCDLKFMLLCMKDYFLEKGKYIQKEFVYDDLEIKNNHVHWNNIIAKKIIFCDGAHSVNNPFFSNLPFNLTKGEVLEIEAKGINQSYIYNKNVFVLPLGDNKFKVGSTYDWDYQNEDITDNAKVEICDKLDKLIDCPYTIVNHQAGIRPTIKDRRPILGYHHEFSQVAIFNGLGTKGLMIAPYYAKEMLELLLNKDYNVNEEVSIKRFQDK